MSRPVLHLFEGFGIELEYMIVDVDTLSVRPIADEVLKAVAGKIVDNVDMPGGITWSNELALHVLELKATRPLPSLEGAAAEFQKNVRHVNEVLRPMNAMLMPTAMHPWMKPDEEMKIWPHAYSEVYETFNRIFNVRGHGWANLQSVHLNLPFANDEEFGKLHAAIRFLLPIMPALAASSPIVEGQVTGFQDTRMEVYRKNAARIPSIAGDIIPEQAFTQREYQEKILEPMYADVAPFDLEGILRNEFLNARGAIARFSRGAIEIRVLDVQECPQADIAICAFIVAVLKYLLDDPVSVQRMREYPSEPLHRLLLGSVRNGGNAVIVDPEYASILGMKQHLGWSLAEVWSDLFERLWESLDCQIHAALGVLRDQGTVARRILTSLPDAPCPNRIRQLYRKLSACLEMGNQFVADAAPDPPLAA
jgi:glutamate---cysteine ligase / carboxylate-amine ligase